MAKPDGRYKIDKSVPIPEVAHTKPSKYPFADMKSGDSFFVKGGVSKRFTSGNSWAKTHGGKFIVRTVTGGIRVWRIE